MPTKVQHRIKPVSPRVERLELLALEGVIDEIEESGTPLSQGVSFLISLVRFKIGVLKNPECLKPFNSYREYRRNAVVLFSGQHWQSNVSGNVGHVPGTTSEFWTAFNVAITPEEKARVESIYAYMCR